MRTYLFGCGVRQIFVIVKAFRVVKDTALLTERDITTTAVILHLFGVFAADDWSVSGSHVLLLGFA